MNGFLSGVILAISYFTGVLALPFGVRFLREKGLVGENFAGAMIPTSYGGVLAFLYLWFAIFLLAMEGLAPLSLFPFTLFLALLVASISAVWLGWLDDTLGDHGNKGLGGHIRAWVQHGTVTTGLIKAVGGLAIAAVAAYVTSGGSVWWPLHTLFIALVTNWLNLLDLRPGRCLKFYLAASVLLIVLTYGHGSTILFMPLVGLALAAFRADLSARIMLGDSGSNLLGIQLGIWVATVSPPLVLLLLTFLLIVGHILGETVSLSRIIENNRLLSYLDRLGRDMP